MIRAAFFDIDGTLIPMTTRKMPESTLSTLHALKEKGVRLYIASGRPPVHLTLLDKALTSFPWDGYIMMNGQYCFDAAGNVFRKEALKQETLEVLVPWLKEYADFPCTIFELDRSYDIAFNESMHNYLSSINRLDQMPPVLDPVRALSHETYMMSPYIPAERDAEFLSHAPGMMSARWSPHFADMIREHGGKPEGIKAALAMHGLDREEAIAFGDGGNDIAMLAYAGIGVAMGNASDEVKAHADYVTDDCENDGIYSAFKHFGLI